MKKMKNLALACLLIFGIAACSDDDSSDNPPANNSETVTKEFTAQIGGEGEVNTITFTNPLSRKAKLDIYVNGNPYDSIIFDSTSSCGDLTLTRGSLEDIPLEKGASCEIKYTYKPTKMDTTLLTLDVDYNIDDKELCPTPETIPSRNDIKNAMNSYKNITMKIYNYAEDENGKKSPKWEILNFDIDYVINGMDASETAPRSSEKEFTLLMQQGEYTFYNYGVDLYNIKNCVRDGHKLTVNGDKGCTFTARAYSDTQVTFTPTQSDNPYYNVEVNLNSKQEYTVLDNYYNNTFSPSYYALNQEEESYFDVAVLKKGEEITSYEITGTNKDKFKVVGTKYDACSVTSNKISIPTGKAFCFYTVDIDKKEAGEFNATLGVTLNSGTNQTYNIEGEVDLTTINDMFTDEFLQNVCKQIHADNPNKSFKLFQ